MEEVLNMKRKTDDYETELIIKNNIYKLTHESGLVREKARKLLESIGSPAVDYLVEFVNHPSKQARWEAVKALGEINDSTAAPFLVNALEDSDSDVRWLAAEALAMMGEQGLRAVFETLIVETDSLFLRKGAHHVISRMAEIYDEPEFKELQRILEEPDAELKIALQGKPYLKKIIAKIRED